tara:strand:+ start:3426 stop:3857 length:432 start_codon:yes stop_codon:yes gene_type:complete
MKVFQNKFLRLLEEEEAAPVEPPMDDEAAFAAGLDDETPPEAFDDVPDNPVAQFQAQQTANTITTLQSWITEVEGFIEYLNGLGDQSINSQLNRTDCDSILADVQRSESKKISRLAQDLSSLGESLKQYLLSAKNKDARAGQI